MHSLSWFFNALSSPLKQRQCPIDVHLSPRDIASFVRRQEDNGVGDLFCAGGALLEGDHALGELAGDADLVDVAGEGVLADAGFGGPGADDIDADVPLRQFDCGHFGKGNLGGLGAGIRGEAKVGEDAVAVDRGDDYDAAAASRRAGEGWRI